MPEAGASNDGRVGDMAALVESWVRSLRARQLSRGTVDAYRSDVELFARRAGVVDTSDLTTDRIERFLSEERALGRSCATIGRRHRSISLFVRWVGSRTALDVAVPSPAPADDGARPHLNQRDLAALLGACTDRGRQSVFASRRDTAIVMLLMTVGSRVSELSRLDLDDIGPECATVRVHGGSSSRTIRVLPASRAAVGAYLGVRSSHPMAGSTDAVFIGARGRLTDSGIRQMLERRCAMAGASVRPHDLRLAVLHDAARRGMAETRISELMGWRSTRMVREYASGRRG